MFRKIRNGLRALRAIIRGGSYYWFPSGTSSVRVQTLRLWFRLRLRLVIEVEVAASAQLASPRPVRLWVDEEAFPRIFTLLRRARHTVYIQMFIWKDDEIGRRMAQTLLDLADRGVRIEIFKEALGDVFEFHRDFLSTQRVSEELWQRFWTHPLIHITYATNNDHAKVFVIDDTTLIITGMNISMDYHADSHDYMVEMHGAAYVTKFLTRGEVNPPTEGVKLIMNTETAKEIRPVLMELIRSAESSILLEHCFIADPEVIKLLEEKTKQGVRVTLITPERTEFLHHFTNMETLSELMQNADAENLQVFLYPTFLHAKILLVDRRKAFIGSANLMTSSIDEMGEVNVLITRPSRAVARLREVLRADILRSRPLLSPSRFRWFIRWLAWLKL